MKFIIIFIVSLSLFSAPLVKTTDDRSYDLKRVTQSWDTNWKKHTINYDELLSGGPPRDGIPPIDKPKFVNIKKAKTWIKDNEPVIFVKIGSRVKAYPLQVLIWHEITNDTLGDKKITVTFCPLCNSSIVFDRNIKGKVYDFGTSGLLRNSDLVMYDRQTESLWQQFDGTAIVGDMSGISLSIIPSSIISFKDYAKEYPNGLVLSKDTGFFRAYGQNPYVGYDDINKSPFLYRKKVDGRLRPMQRVVTILNKQSSKAYSFDILKNKKVINDIFDGKKIVLFYKKGTKSALDKNSISHSRDVGATGVFSPILNGRVLSFYFDKKRGVTDNQTNSTWNIFGKATSGKLKGKELKPITHNNFWFAIAAFKPKVEIYR